MGEQDIRWEQRFDNYAKVLQHLENAIAIPDPDIVQKAGIIQFFEMCFELAWKMVKDYLELEGFVDVKTPRAALKKAFEIGLIEHGHDWMDLLQDRNLTSHTYDERKATEMEQLVHHKYFPLFQALYFVFHEKTSGK